MTSFYSDSSMTASYLPNVYIDRLRAASLQLTLARMAVIRALIRAGTSLTRSEIYRRVVQEDITITLSSVYSAISKMAQAGIVEEHMFDRGRVYALAEMDRPVCLTCVSCGRSILVDDPSIIEFLRETAAQLGFDLKDYTLSIRAECKHGCLEPELGAHAWNKKIPKRS